MTTPNIVTNFVPELDAVAMSGFVFSGKTFEKGQPFPHKELKVDKPALNGLWLSGLIRFVKPPEIPAGMIDDLVKTIRAKLATESGDTAAELALLELEHIARGSVVESPPAPIVYKEDPADEPDPETLKALKDQVKATVPKAPKATAKKQDSTETVVEPAPVAQR